VHSLGRVKTTISIDEDLWKRFSILLIRDGGYRKKSAVVEGLIKEYVEREWNKKERKA